MTSGTYQNKSPKLAAAIAPMGVPIRVEVTEDTHLDKFVEIFHISLDPMPGRAQGFALGILNSFKSGVMEKIDPCHPLLDGLRAIQNLAALRAWEKTGQGHSLFSCQSAGAARTVYRPEQIAVINPGADLISTRDIYLVAALGVVGCPVVSRDDSGKWIVAGSQLNLIFPLGSQTVTASAFGPDGVRNRFSNISAGGFGLSVRAVDTVAAFRSGDLGRICPDHPLAYAHAAARIYEQIIRQKETAVRLVAIKKPGFNRNNLQAALVREDITGKGMDRVGRFFGT